MCKTYKIYKPYGVLSQFTKEHEDHRTLADLYDFPKNVYPIGRLDKDSEGLLLLSSDKTLTDKILNPKNKLAKAYWVQVEGMISAAALEQLVSGITIKIKTGKYHDTLPCEVSMIDVPALPERDPPVRVRQTIPTSWLEIAISEGKNRQVRKMFAKVGYPVLRLVRYSVGETTIEGMKSGDVEEIELSFNLL